MLILEVFVKIIGILKIISGLINVCSDFIFFSLSLGLGETTRKDLDFVFLFCFLMSRRAQQRLVWKRESQSTLASLVQPLSPEISLVSTQVGHGLAMAEGNMSPPQPIPCAM